MRKSIVAVLLMFVLAFPVLAADSNKELSLKAGVLFDPALTFDPSVHASYYLNVPIVAAAEFYYFPKETLGLGLGVNNVFESSIRMSADLKLGFTNVYLGIKPRFAVANDYIDSIYFMGQAGLGIPNMSGKDTEGNIDNGLYWAMGVGVEKNSFLAELIYSVNYTSADEMMGDFTYSSLGMNIGYKFAL